MPITHLKHPGRMGPNFGVSHLKDPLVWSRNKCWQHPDWEPSPLASHLASTGALGTAGVTSGPSALAGAQGYVAGVPAT